MISDIDNTIQFHNIYGTTTASIFYYCIEQLDTEIHVEERPSGINFKAMTRVVNMIIKKRMKL
jgi:hypothetical protein